MPKSASDAFDLHERPTAQRPRPASDTAATQKVEPFRMEGLVRTESGTRPIVTADQIDRLMRERTAEITGEPSADPSLGDRETLDASMLDAPTLPPPPTVTVEDEERRTLVMREGDPQSTAQQIPIDIDLSRLAPKPRPAAGRPPTLLDRVDRRRLTIAIVFVVAMLSALAGFVAGRASL